MTSIADGAVHIQTSPDSVPSIPSWFGEVALMAAHLRKQSVLTKLGVNANGLLTHFANVKWVKSPLALTPRQI